MIENKDSEIHRVGWIGYERVEFRDLYELMEYLGLTLQDLESYLKQFEKKDSENGTKSQS
jgi:hypothetical protein